ncbi:hypothetical protein C4B63_13g328 [Trypanosoma cruzi]|uniref:Uncharacterized protein n=1 Tax=Trypanosoma cruzi TaxID=5693 RepID=A0A2V2VNK2_TRYCR|nr:hypothetical protein C4B63_13g328 [Trypanosoma cruzi]
MALSPSHAFFLLGMASGAILLLSPSCADDRDDPPKVSFVEPERPFSRLEEASTRTTFARIRRRRGIMGMQRITPPHNEENMEEQEQEEEEEEHVALTTPHPPSEPLSHLYRTTPIRTEEEILRQRRRRQPYLRSLTATQIFGNGFREDNLFKNCSGTRRLSLGPCKAGCRQQIACHFTQFGSSHHVETVKSLTEQVSGACT